MSRYFVDRAGNALEPIWSYGEGQKQTMDGDAKTFSLGFGQKYVLVTNAGGVTVYIRADGVAAVSGSAGTIPLAAGLSKEFATDGDVSIIGASGAVYVMPIKA